ncbi:HU family DNA-binding protein [Oceanicella actignis]|uniref:DNA-binding protein HU-beta n=1 Tax=Oceanicella actignis TaxID=1189325 RepID=A0A1M7SXH2_9RHOB|nr:HU family DNA-binding protein [Oceanicella actignis]TYO90555.1 DNA-binding protein HU-beta [Oceanicella actignis]SES75057.1 DNA-binding protein HU-beta [Oceanicella actignis]SHN63074.1 DNA-binding protein HU-beta [Oceanicella actignis]
MKKDELVTALAEASGETKSSVAAVLAALPRVAEAALKQGKTVTINGLGKIDAAERAAREVRNPQTGEKKMAEAHMAPRFKFAAPFKAAIRG